MNMTKICEHDWKYNKYYHNNKGFSKKTTCLRGRVAPWPKLISAEMSTIVYDGGRSRKVKTLKIRPPTWPLIDPLKRPPP